MAAPPPTAASAPTAASGLGASGAQPAAGSGAAAGPDREALLDVIRAAALAVVLAAPLLGPLREPLLCAAAGLAVGVSASLVARELIEQSPEYRAVIGRRLLRMLGPFWLFAALVVPALLLWPADQADAPGDPVMRGLWLWVLPLAAPPTPAAWQPWLPPLALIAAHVVLTACAAGLLWLFRRWPVAVTILVLSLLGAQLLRIVEVGGEAGLALLTGTALAPCSLIGFAHRLGWLRAVPHGAVVLIGLALVAAAGRGAPVWPAADPGALATLGLAVVTWAALLVLLRLSLSVPRLPGWLAGTGERLAGRFATLVLWSAAAVPLGRWVLGLLLPGAEGPVSQAIAAAACLVVIVVLLGGVEDLAAGRRARLGLPRPLPRPAPRRAHDRSARRRGAVLVLGVLLLAGAVGLTGHVRAGPSIVASGDGAACLAGERPRDLTDPRARGIARMLISSAENSSLDWEAQYAYIEYNVEGNAEENRGYTAGIVGFTSRTGDLLQVVQRYADVAPDAALARFLPALETVLGTSSRAGLGWEFVLAWQDADADGRFRTVQREVAEELYFDPSLRVARADGLGLLGQFTYLDAAVMHGFGVADNSFDHIHAAALQRATPPSLGGDERTWLSVFLDEREEALRAEVGHSDTTRVSGMQRVFLTEENLALEPPLRWTVYGDRFEISRRTAGLCR